MDEPDETFTVTLSVPSHARWQPQRRLWQPNVDGMRVAVAGPYDHERVTAWQDGADAQRKNTAGGFVWGLYTKVAKRVDDTAMFPDNATADAMVCRATLARRHRLPLLRVGERADGLQAQEHALPLP